MPLSPRSEAPAKVILLVEDSASDAALIAELMDEVPGSFRLEQVATLGAGLARLREGGIDLLMTDLGLPDCGGDETFAALRAAVPELPIVVISGMECEEVAVRMVEHGAQDYLLKGRIDRQALIRALRYAFERNRWQQELQRAHDSLEQRVAERTAELQTALKELRETQARLVQQERLSALGRMASGIAHDFNNAIAPILGFSELLLTQGSVVQAKREEYLRLIHTSARDSAEIVRRLREFYRYRDEHDVFGPVMLNDVVRQVAALTKPRWKDQALGRGAHIELALDLQHVPAISGHESELRELLINLIFNAVDSIERHGTITCRTFTRGGATVLEVRDTGAGMSEEICRRCLEPFFSTKGEKGTGLGLAMVHGIVRRHDAEMEIASEPGHGAVVTIAFVAYDETKPVDPRAAPPTAAVAPLRVLVVDDEPAIREVLTAYLTADGHTVETAAHGAQALKLHTPGRWDMVLTDRAMPHLNGEHLAAALRQHEPGLPIILVTGFADLMADAGDHPPVIDVVVRKPFSGEDIRAGLAQALALHRHGDAEEMTKGGCRVTKE